MALLTSLPLWALAGVVVEAEAHAAVITLEAVTVEKDALCCLSLHDVHPLLAEIAKLTGRLCPQQHWLTFLQPEKY